MFTRKALKARRQSRTDAASGSEYVKLLRQGETAYRAGKSLANNPYDVGSEDYAIWANGWIDMEQETNKS